jgi:carbon monoxide dehydrogenase subunit G
MELTNEFRVGVAVAEAWAVLTDVERIAPCMPGAELQEIEGDEYRGVVKVKVGPITAQYKGKARFVDKDEANHKAVLRAEGRDTRGQGNANATITATLVADGESATKVTVVTDLAVTGRVANFGRGVLNDVSVKLLNQFVECLETDVLAAGVRPTTGEPTVPAAAPTSPSPGPYDQHSDRPPATEPAPQPSSNGAGDRAGRPDAEPAVRKIESRPSAPVDLLDAAGGSVFKRIGPAVGAVVFLLWLFGRRRKKKAAKRS